MTSAGLNPRKTRAPRRPKYDGQAIKAVSKSRLLSRKPRGQLQTVLGMARLAHQHALRCHDDRTFEAFRREEAVKACNFRISEARDVHFVSLMAHFSAMAKHKDAIKWALRTPDAEASDRLRNLCRAEVMRALAFSEEEAERLVDKLAKDQWGSLAKYCNATQLDYLLRERVRPVVADMKKARNAEGVCDGCGLVSDHVQPVNLPPVASGVCLCADCRSNTLEEGGVP